MEDLGQTTSGMYLVKLTPDEYTMLLDMLASLRAIQPPPPAEAAPKTKRKSKQA